ncbi:MAG: helix-turn-helix transcriptional regulator [Pedobacter sp.]
METQNIAVIPMPFGAEKIQFAIIDVVHTQDSEHLLLPHRHEHYCCFIATAGSGQFKVDFQVYSLCAPCVMVLYPGQVHELIEGTGIKGWALNFSSDIVDEVPKNIFEQAVSPLGAIDLDETQKQWFTSLMSLMEQSFSQQAPGSYSQTIQAMTNAFFFNAAEIFSLQDKQRTVSHSTRKIEIVQTFRKLIKRNFKQLKRPVDYAALMHVTVSHLNDTVKSVTGSSATLLIQQHLLTEAQRLLYYTTYNIKEISHSLGFEDEKYFTRLFHKRKGVSPTVFRKSTAS